MRHIDPGSAEARDCHSVAASAGRPADAASGDDDASVILASLSVPSDFEMIFDRYYSTVVGYLRRRVAISVASDIAAETFLKAFEGRSRYRPESDTARPWLLGIASNLLRRHWRRETRELRAYARTGRDPLVDEYRDVDSRVDAQKIAPRLARALSMLRREERDVLALHTWAGLSNVEIAEALGLPEGTVRSRLSRARKRVREQIGDIGQR